MREVEYIGLVVAGSFIVNCGYVAANLYELPGVLSLVFIPCSVVVALAWFIRNMKATIVASLTLMVLTAALTQLSLSAPVVLGIIEHELYRNLFVYTVFLKVVQYVFMTTFFALIAALMAGLAFE